MTNHPTPSPGPGAALKGASLAFSNNKTSTLASTAPSPNPRSLRPPPSTSTSSTSASSLALPSPSPNHLGGALKAATQAASGKLSPHHTGRSQGALSRQTTGGSTVSNTGRGGALDGSPYLLPDGRSTSFIAATLAASRSASPAGKGVKENLTGTGVGTGRPRGYSASPVPARMLAYAGSDSGDADAEMGREALDTSSIPPTTSLISMFEGGGNTDPVKRKLEETPRLARPQMRPPTPERELSPRRNKAEDVETSPNTREVVSPIPRSKPRPAPVLARAPLRAPTPERELSPRISKVEDVERSSTSQRQLAQDSTRATAAVPAEMKPKPIPKPKPTPRSSPSPQVEASLDTRRPSAVVSEAKPQLPTPAQKRTPVRSIPKPLHLDGSPPGPSRTGVPTSAKRPTTATSASSNDSFVSATSTQRAPSPVPASPSRPMPRRSPRPSPRPSPPPTRSRGRPPPNEPRTLSRPTTPRATQQPPPAPPSKRKPPTSSTTPTSSSTSLPLDSLTDAIMASSLASARVTPNPTSSLPPPPPTRRRHGHHHSRPRSTNPSPRRTTMLQTLRSPPSKSDDEKESNGHHHHHSRVKVQSGRHKHHEGSRRRWRDEVTPPERKRYEAVWASNRGLFLEQGEGDCVVNVVVRDIWMRSRLPVDELAEVWDLVERRGNGEGSDSNGGKGKKVVVKMGRLTKEEFVVGMWLVDQRLRGRKIPTRVGDSVWASVKGLRVLGPTGR